MNSVELLESWHNEKRNILNALDLVDDVAETLLKCNMNTMAIQLIAAIDEIQSAVKEYDDNNGSNVAYVYNEMRSRIGGIITTALEVCESKV